METFSRKNLQKNTFYCFSPAVMLGTFVTETLLAVYVLLAYKLNTPVKRLIFVILLLLATFQLVEYQICQIHDQALINLLARIGFIAITFLPALGLHLSSAIAKRKISWYIYVGYAMSIGWAIYFGLYNKSILQGICGANYAIFDLPQRLMFLWGTYYIGLLFVGVWEAYTLAKRKKYKKRKEALLYLTTGYLLFMIPAGIVVYIVPAARIGLPSVMCGFAILLAFTLVCFVLPRASKK